MYCARSEWGKLKYAHEYYGGLYVLERRFVRAVEATLPMSQTEEEEANGRVLTGLALAGLAGAALVEWAQDMQHGAPVAA